ncbi:MAG: FAD:protein FMN transferase [Phycisphaera sp.]|nr:FAD:protein FMN transferase [Phycisphaera sp.]
MIRRTSFIVCGLLLLATLSACSTSRSLHRYEFTEQHMGTMFKVVLYAPDDVTADVASVDAYKRVEQLNDILSDYHATSEIRRLSDTSGSGRAVPVSEDLYRVLKRSVEVSEMSDGAFDVSVGPVIRLWRWARRHNEMPPKDSLDKAVQAVGYKHIVFDSAHQAITLTQPGMRLDVGGIAKGYACDAMLAVLRRYGVTRALIDAGGDLAFSDPPPDRDTWRIALPQLLEPGDSGGASATPPVITKDTPMRYVLLRNGAVATSGDVYQHVVIDGVRYSHIVNPKTGIGLTTPMTVTVVAPDGATADALASTVSVLGPDKGIALIDSLPDTAAFVTYIDTDGGIATRASQRWGGLKHDGDE